MARLIDRPTAERDRLVALLAARGQALAASDADLLICAHPASLVLGSLLADRLHLPLVYVRPRPKGHGKQNQLEGRLPAGARGLIICDTPAAAPALADSLTVLAPAGARATAALVVQPADPGDAAAVADQHGLPLDVVSSDDLAPAPPSPGRASQAPFGTRDIPDRRPEMSPGTGPAGDPDARPTRPAETTAPAKNDAHPVGAPTDGRARQVAEALLDVGALAINRQQPFVYASGMRSPIYTDCRLLLARPDVWQTVIDGYAALLAEKVGPDGFDLLAGTATSGIPHAARLADRLGCPLVYLTFDDPSAGERGTLHGPLPPGARVVMIEDLISTGGSVLTAAAGLRARGAQVDWCLAIFTYGQPVAAANFARQAINKATMSDLATALIVARERGAIQATDEATVEDWARDPAAWSALIT
jgi:orotate phosphoribosyltransferase